MPYLYDPGFQAGHNCVLPSRAENGAIWRCNDCGRSWLRYPSESAGVSGQLWRQLDDGELHRRLRKLERKGLYPQNPGGYSGA